MIRRALRSAYHRVADVPLAGPVARRLATLLRGGPEAPRIMALSSLSASKILASSAISSLRVPSTVTRVTPDIRKARHRFVPASDHGFAYSGAWGTGHDGVMISKEPDAQVIWNGPVQGAILVLVCHPYSGVIGIEAPGHAHVTDNHHWFTFARAFPLSPTVRGGPLRISVVGRNPLARGAEVVLAGIWLPQGDPVAAPVEDATAFEDLQAQMVDNWMDNIRRGGGSVEAVTRKRQAAYLHRWRETLPYAPPNSSVLDLGAGFLYEDLFRFFRENDFDYTAIDIDRRAVDSNRANGAPFGFGPERFLHGRNTQLDVPDGSADLVFASHCIEHSDDLPRTFAELRRVLQSGGHIFFAVPTTVDTSEEHTYFFSHADWVAFTEEQGFEIVNQHIGSTYPETGHDILIVARTRA
jgi:SAM-dependent methyltransferase